MEQGGHSKVTPALDPSTSALNRKQHTEAERQEPSNDTRAASAFTSKRPKRSQTSSITKKKKTRPDVCLVEFSISRHSVREAAFKRGAVRSLLNQTSPTQRSICRKLCAHSYCRLESAFFNGLSDGAQQRPCTSRRPQQSPVRQEWQGQPRRRSSQSLPARQHCWSQCLQRA